MTVQNFPTNQKARNKLFVMLSLRLVTRFKLNWLNNLFRRRIHWGRFRNPYALSDHRIAIHCRRVRISVFRIFESEGHPWSGKKQNGWRIGCGNGRRKRFGEMDVTIGLRFFGSQCDQIWRNFITLATKIKSLQFFEGSFRIWQNFELTWLTFMLMGKFSMLNE